MSDLIDRTRLINSLNDWALQESPVFTTDTTLKYSSRDMKSKIYHTILETISAIEAQLSWIPVTERMPEKSGKYLVTVRNGNVYAGTYSAHDKAFSCAATAWMPLPDPYEEAPDA